VDMRCHWLQWGGGWVTGGERSLFVVFVYMWGEAMVMVCVCVCVCACVCVCVCVCVCAGWVNCFAHRLEKRLRVVIVIVRIIVVVLVLDFGYRLSWLRADDEQLGVVARRDGCVSVQLGVVARKGGCVSVRM
jgi:hypothetical protein